MLLHWSLAILIFSVGLSSPFIDHTSTNPFVIFLGKFHNAGGLVALGLAIASLIWWARRTKELEPAAVSRSEQSAMTAALFILSGLLVIAPLTGIAYFLAVGGRLDLGFVALSYDAGLSRPTLQMLGFVHHLTGAALVVLAGVHSLHAVWHHVVVKDGLLGRMLPGHD
jgi:cytochrome b561